MKKKSYFKRSLGITGKFNALAIILVIFTSLVTSYVLSEREKTKAFNSQLEHGNIVTQLISGLSEYALYSEDEAAINSILNAIDHQDFIRLSLFRG